jgi:single-strand DNA-binding protein
LFLIGRLTKDPELRYTPKNPAVADVSIAISRIYSSEDGGKKEETTFVNVTLWARLAEVVQQYCKNGSPIFCEGRLQLDSWDDKQTGQKRSRLRVVAENLQLLGDKARSAAPSAPPDPPRPAGLPRPASTVAKTPLVDPPLDVDPF